MRVFFRKHLVYFILISIALLITFLPVILSNNYLRQDDLSHELWPGMRMSDFGYLYYNTVYQLVRPVGFLLNYLSFIVSIDMHHSMFVRLTSIFTVMLIGILLYYWQELLGQKKFFSVSFAITALTLPAFQLFVATANYFCIIFAILLSMLAMFCWFYSYHAHPNKNVWGSKWLFLLGCTLFFVSLLDYPLASMFVWLMLTIYYLQKLAQPKNNKFLIHTIINIIGLMFCYFVFIKLFHILFHVNLKVGRSAIIENSSIFSKFIWLVKLLKFHAALWFYKPDEHWKYQIPIIFISILFFVSLVKLYLRKGITNINLVAKKVIINVSVILFLFLMAYSPALSLKEIGYTFRYSLTTMPLLLYIFMWSIVETSSLNIKYFVLAIFALFGISYGNLMLADGIVGPYEGDFNYIQKVLREKALPLLQHQTPFVIHAIQCNLNHSFNKGIPTSLEYGMRLCQYQNHLVGAIEHSLLNMGYLSNFRKEKTFAHFENEFIVITPWGVIIVSSLNGSHQFLENYIKRGYKVITIALTNGKSYNRFDFYKTLIQ